MSVGGPAPWEAWILAVPPFRVNPHVPHPPGPSASGGSALLSAAGVGEWASGLCVHMCASISLCSFTAPVTEEQHCVRGKYGPESQELQMFILTLYR